ncbi:MAG: GNAT family N-acetyltransferase [Armatimonadetes bacterium]|nr:GNAT family N-acetyltransferase [Armatimonadota bacterium]
MRIESYRRDYLEEMTSLYNDETAYEPHIAPLNPKRFITMVEDKSYFDPEGLRVALDGGRVVGWIHACVAPPSEMYQDGNMTAARIRMLIFPRDRLQAGSALVAEATAWLKGSGKKEFEAIHAKAGYPFYRGIWLGGEPMGPADMPHVQLAFEVGGYKNTHESVFMAAGMPAPPSDAPASPGLEMEEFTAPMRHEGMRESWIGFEPMGIRAFLGGEEAGSLWWAVLPHVAERLGAPCMNIWGLGVSEIHRQKGIASALIARAMARSYTLGCRFASVGTQLWNAPAHASYAKFGFVPYRILVGRTSIPEGVRL